MRLKQRHIPPEQPTRGWLALADIDQIEALLQACAKSGKPICYAETLDCIGLSFSRPKMRGLCAALTEIDRRARERGEPELAVLVVRKSDGVPGAGWWLEKDDNKFKGEWTGPKALAYVRKKQQIVIDFWQGRK